MRGIGVQRRRRFGVDSFIPIQGLDHRWQQEKETGDAALAGFLLLVEDDLDLAGAIRMGLEDDGFRPEHVADGDTGLRRALSREHGLVILDVRLPGMNGFDLCRQLRQSSNVPVLFLTARNTELVALLLAVLIGWLLSRCWRGRWRGWPPPRRRWLKATSCRPWRQPGPPSWTA